MLAAALLLLSMAGVALAVYMTRVVTRPPRCEADACAIAVSTQYARVFGFPNSILAAVFFAATAAFAGLRLAGVVVPLWQALAASGLSLVMSAYLAWALAFRVRRF